MDQVLPMDILILIPWFFRTIQINASTESRRLMESKTNCASL